MSGVELFALPAVLGGSTVTLGAAMTAAGTVFSAASMLQQGAAAKASSRYNAALYERNSQIAQQNAAFQEDRQRRLATQRMGANRAAIGSYIGVTMDGSALDILESNAAQEELDALMIRWNGANAAGDLMSNAGLQRAQGTNAQIGSYIGAGSSILLGGAKTADRLKEPSGVKLTAGQTNPGREL